MHGGVAGGRRDDGWESERNREEGAVCSSRARYVHLLACSPPTPPPPPQEQMLRDPVSLDLKSVLIKVPESPVSHQALLVAGVKTPSPSPSLVAVTKAGNLESVGPGSKFQLCLLLAV